MPVSPPPLEALAEILSDVSSVVADVDVYEQDGHTPYALDVPLIDGSVSVDATRQERRNIQVTIDNQDRKFDPKPGAFWYDKVIKPYRGVSYDHSYPYEEEVLLDKPAVYYRLNDTLIATTVVQDASGNNRDGTAVNTPVAGASGAIKDEADRAFHLTSASVEYVQVGAGTFMDFGPRASYEIWFKSAQTSQAYLYYGLDGSGGGFIRMNNGGTSNQFAVQYGNSGVRTFTYQTHNSIWHHLIFTVSPSAMNVYIDGSLLYTGAAPTSTPTVSSAASKVVGIGPLGANPFDGDVDEFAAYNHDLSPARVAAHYNAGRGVYRTLKRIWKVQLGEFMIDEISSSNFPHRVNITGRDYMKKLILSKFRQATSFTKGSPVDDLLKIIAVSGGITKYILVADENPVTTKDFFFDRDVSRADAIKQIGDAYGFDIFFDATGYLVMHPFQDPLHSPFMFTFETGQYGNIVSYEKSVSDTAIFNVIVVAGEATDTIPVWDQAVNNEPSSPTRVAELGERVLTITSPLITKKSEATALAKKYLKVNALEEYNVNLGSIVLPWIEANNIIEFLDPERVIGDDPVRFLLSDFTIPLKLGTMSSTAKRVTIVG